MKKGKIKENGRQLLLFFQIHQPARLLTYDASEKSDTTEYFDRELDKTILQKIAIDGYILANKLLFKLIGQYPQLKIAFSISGTALEQMQRYTPEVIASFRELVDTGAIEIFSQPYYNSFPFLLNSDEMEAQILLHAEKVYECFGVRPSAFINTQLFYNNDIGKRIAMMGYHSIITEGSNEVLQGNLPHSLYRHVDDKSFKIITRNPDLSNDLAFHVRKMEWGLSPEKYMSWLDSIPKEQSLVTIGVPYDALRTDEDGGTTTIDFLESLLLLLAMQQNYKMILPSEVGQASKNLKPLSVIEYQGTKGCPLSMWLGNERQKEAFAALSELEDRVKASGKSDLLEYWRYLQSVDHFLYMSDDPAFSTFASPQLAFEQYMRTISSLRDQLAQATSQKTEEQINAAVEAERREIKEPTWAMAMDHNHGQPH